MIPVPVMPMSMPMAVICMTIVACVLIICGVMHRTAVTGVRAMRFGVAPSGALVFHAVVIVLHSHSLALYPVWVDK